MNRVPKWIPIVLFLFIVTIFALTFLMPSSGNAEELEDEEVYYGVLEDDSDLYALTFDKGLVIQIQKALNKYLKKHVRNYTSIREDGVFGPATGQAVKLFQYKKGLKIDGICGPKTLRELGIDPTGITDYPRWIPNLLESFSKSTSGMGVHLNLGSHKYEVWRQVDGEWRLIRVMLAATGNFSKGNFTDLMDGLIGGTKHKYISGKSNGKEWRGYYATLMKNGDFTHSLLAHKKNGKWVFDDDSALGKDVTHGCIRLSVENAEWVYLNVEPGTACVIDDRAWDFPVTH